MNSRANLGFYIAPEDPLLAERLPWLRDQGVGHIGFDGLRYNDPETYRQIRGKIEASGLNLQVIHGEVPLVSLEGDDESIRRGQLGILARAKGLGAKLVVVHYRHVQDPATDMVDHDRRMTDTLRWLADEAAAVGLSIAVENVPRSHPFGYRVDELIEFLASLDLPNVRFCLDTGHAHLSGLDVPETIRQAGQWLLTTHFHDNFGFSLAEQTPAQRDRHFVPGLGTINWPAVIVALEEVHFPGPIMFEGVRTIPHGPLPDFELAGDLTLRNWEQFVKIARTMSEPSDRS